jgi:hypothetical protein
MNEPKPPRTRVHLDRDLSVFEELSTEDRMRLFVRILCELVAYGEPVADPVAKAPAAPEPVTASLTDAA